MTDKFPGWRYGPKGEAEIFQCEADVPKGWTDNPNDFKKAGQTPNELAEKTSNDISFVTEGAKQVSDELTFDRTAAIETLKAAGVSAKGTWGDAKLKAALADLPPAA